MCSALRRSPRISVGTRSSWSILSGRTLRDFGRELGVNHETLRGWANAANRVQQRGHQAMIMKLHESGVPHSGVRSQGGTSVTFIPPPPNYIPVGRLPLYGIVGLGRRRA